MWERRETLDPTGKDFLNYANDFQNAATFTANSVCGQFKESFPIKVLFQYVLRPNSISYTLTHLHTHAHHSSSKGANNDGNDNTEDDEKGLHGATHH